MSEKSLLLVTSFGTTDEATCNKNITAVETHLAHAFPDFTVRRAFTSEIIRKILAKRGTFVPNVPEALKQAQLDGFSTIIVAPTHLLYGIEYDKLCEQVESCRDLFERPISIAKPLLASTEDIQELVHTLSDAFASAADTALALMGHGTHHYVNAVYAALQTAFNLAGRKDVLVGTVEAWPGIDEIVAQLKEGRYTKVTLAPLMLVAGDHAQNDMAGTDEDSWKSLLQKNGFNVEVVLRGLGEYELVRAQYEQHVRDALEQGAND